jgi:hypothetical protein
LDIFYNQPLLSSLGAMVMAQAIKVLTEYWRTKSWRANLLTSTGGMPSSHSALVAALTVSIGLSSGFGTPLFAVTAIFSLVVMHDAAGVRRAAGKQAEAINILFSRLENQGLKLDKKLKELLGHSPVEVAAGAVFGILVAVAADTFFW